MSIPVLTNPSGLIEWARQVRLAVMLNTSGYPYRTVETLPNIADVLDGYTVFDKTTGKVWTASGGLFYAHW